MRLSIDVICEQLGGQRPQAACGGSADDPFFAPMDCEVVRRTEERLIESPALVRTLGASADADDSCLYVVPEELAQAFAARHRPSALLVVAREKSNREGAAQESKTARLSSAFFELRELAWVETSLCPAEVYARVVEAFEHYRRWDATMLSAIAERQGIAAVLEIASHGLTNAIALFDGSQVLIAHAGSLPPGARDTIWGGVLEHGYMPLDFYSRAEIIELEHVVSHAWPVVSHPSADPGRSYASTLVSFGGATFGSLGLVDLNGPFTPGQLALIDLVRSRLEDAISSDGLKPGEAGSSEYLLRTLLSGGTVDDRVITRHLALKGWNDETQFRLLVVPGLVGGKLRERLYRMSLAKELRHAVLSVHETCLVALMSADDYEASLEDPAKMARKFLGNMIETVFVSEPFVDVRNIRPVLNGCLKACELADGDSRPTRLADAYEALVADAIAERTAGEMPLDTRVLALARRGYRGDVHKGRELVGDLYAYLANGCNAQRAARAIYLHRNTLLYRMGLLAKQLGYDFNSLEPWQVVYLELSCIAALHEQ